MKKLICVLFAIMLFTACNKDGDRFLRTETWIVASEMRIGGWPQGFFDTLVVKYSEDDKWHFFYNDIENFDWEQGYEYELKVRVYKVNDPMMDQPDRRYILRKIVSKTRKDSEGLPGDIIPWPEE